MVRFRQRACFMYGAGEKYMQDFGWKACRKETTWKTRSDRGRVLR
jgi:outer membrane protease